MDTVQNRMAINAQLKTKSFRDTMNNDIHSTSSDEHSPPPRHPHNADTISRFNSIYSANYNESAASDNEILDGPRRIPQKIIRRNHHKSMGNINDTSFIEEERNLNRVQNSLSNLDITRKATKKYETFQIPIVGYEVMEERARFTIYKLKVEDNKRDHSWLVFRRYTDFVRLYSRLKSEQLNITLPLPGKRWFRDNFDPQFLDDRVRGLQVFVNAIVKKLPNHPVVREFFCLDEPPQVYSYQPEVQAVYGALEDSISSLKQQVKQRDATITHLQTRLAWLEAQVAGCSNCSTKIGAQSV
ncbi:unnamed protein product [Plutella xylostella]|uniref:(diamondback moth) hypothetical protein n=1 Tax=Plutella xylostella TaxID=51655 RepID=A0A8S4EXE0_PLUXY|nr:unnamed protein product [Plutella xylostella]